MNRTAGLQVSVGTPQAGLQLEQNHQSDQRPHTGSDRTTMRQTDQVLQKTAEVLMLKVLVGPDPVSG